LLDAAFVVGFVPTVPGNWAAPPANVGQALDDLAARPSGVQQLTQVALPSAVVPVGTANILQTIGMVPTGTRLQVSVHLGGTAIPAPTVAELYVWLDYSTDGGATYTNITQALPSGWLTSGVSAGNTIATFDPNGWIEGLTPGVAVIVRLSMFLTGPGSTFEPANGAPNFFPQLMSVSDFG